MADQPQVIVNTSTSVSPSHSVVKATTQISKTENKEQRDSAETSSKKDAVIKSTAVSDKKLDKSEQETKPPRKN